MPSLFDARSCLALATSGPTPSRWAPDGKLTQGARVNNGLRPGRFHVAFAATRLKLVLALLGLLALCAPAAWAADVTINFDQLPVGTQLTNEYASNGVTFGTIPSWAPPNTLSAPLVIQSGAYAHSGSQFAAMMLGGPGSSWVTFPTYVDHVSMFVSIYSPTFAGAQPVSLFAFDPNGVLIAVATAQAQPESFATNLSVAPGGGAKIASVRLVTRDIPDCCFIAAALDDLTYGPVSTSPGPDFGLIPQMPSVNLPIGVPVTLPMQLDRYGGSSGAISFSATAPPGLTVSFSPSAPTGDGTVAATFSATTPITSGSSGTITIAATPTVSSAGPSAHSISIPYFVQATVDLFVQGIEVTQGITNTGALQPVLSGNYPGMQLIPPSCSVGEPPQDCLVTVPPKGGIPVRNPLAAHNRTIARVYVDAQGAPSDGIEGVSVLLHGFSGGRELPGSPLVTTVLSPNAIPDIGVPPVGVSQSERTSSNNSFNFELPDSWTQGTINLVANAEQELSFSLIPKWVACSTIVCQGHNSFTLFGITFTALPWVVIAPLQVAQPSDPPLPSNSSQVFKRALLTEPGANQFLVLPFVGSIDPSPEIAADSSNPKNLNNDYHQAIVDWDPTSQTLAPCTVPGGSCPLIIPTDILVGVQGTQNGDTSGSLWNELVGPAYSYASVNFNRPLTSVAHELGHALGRNHADDSAANGQADGSGSTGCGGGAAHGHPMALDTCRASGSTPLHHHTRS